MADVAQSMADFLLAVLDDWKKFAKFLVLIVACCLIVYGLVWLVLRNLPKNTSAIEIGSSHILFSQITKDGQRYIVVVAPQGWQRTGIFVPDGAILTVDAGGKVHVDLTGLVNALNARREAEKRVYSDKAKGKLGHVNEADFAAEDYFTPDEKKAMKPTWNWVGPDGVAYADMQIANPARRKRTFAPGEGYGALIGAFNDKDQDPTDDPKMIPSLVSGAFAIGTSYKHKIREGGYLYLAVNDVQAKDPDFPDMFLIDNIGSFYAKLDVSK